MISCCLLLRSLTAVAAAENLDAGRDFACWKSPRRFYPCNRRDLSSALEILQRKIDPSYRLKLLKVCCPCTVGLDPPQISLRIWLLAHCESAAGAVVSLLV